MIVSLEKYRARLAPIWRAIQPALWKECREQEALVSSDLAKIAPFFAVRGQVPTAGKTVVFATTVPLPFTLKFEGLFSRALGLRGWRTLCAMDVHNNRITRRYHGDLLGNPVLRITDFITFGNRSAIGTAVDRALREGMDAVRAFDYNGSLVGLSALSSVSIVDSTGSIDTGNPDHAAKLRHLMVQSCLYTDACERLLRHYRPDLVMTMEKGGVGASELFFQSVRMGVDLVQWSGCQEPESLMYKRYNPDNLRSHPFSVSAETWSEMLTQPWRDVWREEILRQFEEGYGGNRWFQYKRLTDNTHPAEKAEIVARLGLDPTKKIAVVFSHILNDANLFYGKDLFQGGFREWLVETVRAAAENPRVNWLIKLHPANTYRRANMGYKGEYGEILAIRQTLGELPSNLKIIYPDDPANPLSWFRALDYGVTVRGTVGAEIPCFGNRVLTAGTGRYSGLGFTDDSSTAEEYLTKIRTIDKLPPPTEEETRMAFRHAHLFFRLRPTPYRSYACDVFAHPLGHLFNRDVAFHASHYSEAAADPQLAALIDWLSGSRAEDFLTW